MHLLVLFGKYENINDVTKSISFIDLSLFGSVVAVAFQSAFSCRNASKWYFKKKNYFWNQRIKTIQNIKKLIFSKKKLIFLETRLGPRFQTHCSTKPWWGSILIRLSVSYQWHLNKNIVSMTGQQEYGATNEPNWLNSSVDKPRCTFHGSIEN